MDYRQSGRRQGFHLLSDVTNAIDQVIAEHHVTYPQDCGMGANVFQNMAYIILELGLASSLLKNR